MATTSIWAVKGWLGQVVIYIENPHKTENPNYIDNPDMTKKQAQGLTDVINYAMQNHKTEHTNEHAEIKQNFVTGVNCHVDTARDEMMATKKHFNKTEGIVAFHGFQSFAPGEVTPEIAHEIGVKLAEKLWGDKFQVIVATHLDKKNHLHNHFALNNVSMFNGKKYIRTGQDYRDMQNESDRLCREYGLSVIDQSQNGKAKHYAQWKAEHEGKPTYHSIIKHDVDSAIRQSMTERQLWENLRKRGYIIKFGQDITLRLEGRERGLKLQRNFGVDYSIDSIRNRILAQTRPERIIIQPETPQKKYLYKGNTFKPARMTGLRALYFYYLYRMGVLPRKHKRSNRQAYFLFRDDIRFVQRISQEARLLAKHGIDNTDQLAVYKSSIAKEMEDLINERKTLRNYMRSSIGKNKQDSLKSEITSLSKKICEKRREVKLCEEIERRSTEIEIKLHQARNNDHNRLSNKSRGKENPTHESGRRRS